jgi:hypothetical protein
VAQFLPLSTMYSLGMSSHGIHGRAAELSVPCPALVDGDRESHANASTVASAMAPTRSVLAREGGSGRRSRSSLSGESAAVVSIGATTGTAAAQPEISTPSPAGDPAPLF